MAEPARKSNADVDPTIRPDLRAIPGGGQTTSGRGDLSIVKDLEENPDTPADEATPEDESNPKSSVIQGPWEDKTGTSGDENIDQPKFQRALGFAKKRGGIIGLIGLFGVGGGLMAGLFAPAGMLINLMENFSLSNDTSSTALERRFMKAFGFATNSDNVLCSGSKLKCDRKGKISNSAIRALNKKGIISCMTEDRLVQNTGARTGYPDKSPVGYGFEDGVDSNGVKKYTYVSSADLPKYLVDNPKMAAKLLGTSGAINLRVKAWTGKHITNKFYKKFGIKRNGGLADGTNNTGTTEERRKALREKLATNIPDASKVSGVTSGIEKKITGQLGKAKKGGAGYVAAVATCIGVKAPMYVAAGVAAVQLAQILPIVMDVVLSPGAKAKSVAIGSGFTAEDMEGVGTLLTERTQDPETGEYGSALDSEILQSAAGINSGRPELSSTLTPGLAYLTSPLVIASFNASKASEPACNAIMSPVAMYTALAVDSAVTVAASATIIGGVVKIVGSFVISEVVTATAGPIIADAAGPALVELAKSEAIPSAQGKALGDVLGISASGFFSSGGLSRNLPVLTESQNADFMTVKQENDEFNKEMEIASLSPFDTSSRHTFLGSIVYNMQMGVMYSPSYTGGFSSILSSVLNLPAYALSSKVSAATNTTSNSCSYAKDFGLDTGDPATTPAINLSGLPCTGITSTQASMSTEQALDLIAGAGWFDEDKNISDDATIQDLVSSGYIKKDTPLYDYIEDCSNPETGDYIFNSAGCTISTVGGTKTVDELNESFDADGALVCDDEDDSTCVPGGNVTTSPDALTAMPVFLLDYQTQQIFNGEDDNNTQTTEDPEPTEEVPATDTPGTTETPAVPTNIIYNESLSNSSLLAVNQSSMSCFVNSRNPLDRCLREVQHLPYRLLGIA